MPQLPKPDYLVSLGLAIFVFFLPIYKQASTAGELLAALGWLLATAQNPSLMLQNAKKNLALRWFGGIFLLYLLGMVYTQNITLGLAELNGKHYLVSIPLFLGYFATLPKKHFSLLDVFIWGNVVAGTAIIFTYFSGEIWLYAKPDVPSPFVQRPRASIFLAFALLLCVEQCYKRVFFTKNAVFAGVLLLALLVLQGRIGQLGFGVMCLVWAYIRFKKKLNTTKLTLGLVAALCVAALAVGQVKVLKKPFLQAITELKQAENGFKNVRIKDSSMGMRVVYYQVYAQILGKNPVLGVGTGDMEAAAKPFFSKKSSYFLPYNKPHNQFLECLILFGIVGLCAFLGCILGLILGLKPKNGALGGAFWAMMLISMCLDSTLGTQVGVSFCVVFGSLFVLVDAA